MIQVRDLALAARWDFLLHIALRQRVLPIIAHRLETIGDCRVPPEFTSAAIAVRSRLRREASIAELAQLDFLRRCEARGAPAVSIKGPDLARRIYGDIGLRPFTDLDVLMPFETLSVATAVAQDLGFARIYEPLDRQGRPLLHITFVHVAGRLPSIEVHWRVHWYETKFGRDAIARCLDAGAHRRLVPEDELIALLLFFARDGLQGVRYQADLVAWWTAYAEKLDFDLFRQLRSCYPDLRHAIDASIAALNFTVDLDMRHALGLATTNGLRLRLAVRVATPIPAQRPAEMSARAAIVDALVAPAEQVPRVLLRRVLAPQAALERRMPTVRGFISGVPTAARRVVTQVMVLFLAMTRRH